jgi:hypothetical protein
MIRPVRTLCSRRAFTSPGAASPVGARSRAFLLGALLASGLACGQDVLVARWTLLSETRDASPNDDPGGPDAGVNEESLHAQRARERARMRETPIPSDSDNHSSDKNH